MATTTIFVKFLKKVPILFEQFSGISHYLRCLQTKMRNSGKNILCTLLGKLWNFGRVFFVKIFIIFYKNNNMYLANQLSCVFFIISSFFVVYIFFYIFTKFLSPENPRTKIHEYSTKKCTLFLNVIYWVFQKKPSFFLKKPCTLFLGFNKMYKKSNDRKKTKILKKVYFLFLILWYFPCIALLPVICL